MMRRNPRALGFAGASCGASAGPEEDPLIVWLVSPVSPASAAAAGAPAVLALVARPVRHHQHAALGAGRRAFMSVTRPGSRRLLRERVDHWRSHRRDSRDASGRRRVL